MNVNLTKQTSSVRRSVRSLGKTVSSLPGIATRLSRMWPEVVRNYPLIPKLGVNYLKLLAGRPVLRFVDFSSTFQCQLNCQHCHAKPFREDPVQSARMSLAECKSAIDQCLALGAIGINFVGGDPLCDERLPELIAHIPRTRAISSLTTNGYDLDRAMVRRLKDAGLCYLAVSLDYDDAVRHDRFRGASGAFERAREGIEEARAASIPVLLSTTALQETLDDGTVDRLVEYARSIGTWIALTLPVYVGNWANKGHPPITPEAQEHFRRLHTLPHVRSDETMNYWQEGCAAGVEKISITASGEVLPCVIIQVTFGNVRKEPLERIWRRMMSIPEFSGLHENCIASGGPDFPENPFMARVNRAARVPIPAEELFPSIREGLGR